MASALGAALVALLASGCPQPADLQNPEQYPKPAAASANVLGASDGAATCESPCMAKVLESCRACHGAATPSAMLDLSEGYTARLMAVPATHTDIVGSAAGCPSGDLLLDATTPTESWLLKKVAAEQGECGEAMPPGSGLVGDALKCVQDYVSCVAEGS